MAKKIKLPKTIYAKQCGTKGNRYLVASTEDEKAISFDNGDVVGVYELKEDRVVKVSFE